MAQTKNKKSTFFNAIKAASGSKKRESKSVNKKKSSSGNTKKSNAKADESIKDEVMFILFFVLCVLMFLSCFGVCGKFGEVIGSLLFGVFGLLAYVVPLVLFAGVVYLIVRKNHPVAIIKFIAGIVGIILLQGFFHMFFKGKTLQSLKDIYNYCALHHSGGGIVGGGIYRLLSGWMGAIGAFVMMAALLIIVVVIISEKSFVGGVKKSSRKVYDVARTENEKRKERMAERREKKRTDRKVYGVDMGGGLVYKEQPKKELLDLLKLKKTPEIIIPEIEPVELISPKEPLAEFKEEPVAVLSEEPIIESQEMPVAKGRKKTEPAEPIEIPVTPVTPTVKEYQFPPLRLLAAPKGGQNRNSVNQLRETAAKLQQILKDFGVSVTVTDVSCGPTVTRYELQPDQGVKVSKVLALADDIKLNLAVADIRIEAPIPGKAAIGIEVPNKENSMVTLRELLASEEFNKHGSNLAFAVGKDIGGKTIITDIAKMPHLLIAGATGSGKSVCINTLIMSLLYKASPEDVKLIMIDPKVVELSAYNGIPHLLIPVVTDPKKAAGALNWAVAEMTRRYQLFAEYQVRNLQGYNDKVKGIELLEDENKPQKMPQIVIIVDELADLMMVAPGDVEDAICRLAQLARAAGIHLIIATQRPSVNVITGLIKANMPSRLAFAVSSGVDSRTILDMNGAEKLLGKGDMLFYPYGYPKPVRIQGAFVSDDEVSAVVEFLKMHNEAVGVNTDLEEHLQKQQTTTANGGKAGADESGNDPLFVEAGKFIIEKEKASIGMLQRWFKIGFNRAARIMDQLAEAGVVGEEQGTKPREILMSMERFEQYIDEYF